MEIPDVVLHAVVQKFPDLSQEIIRMFVENESFREICEDYVICLNAVLKMTDGDNRKDKYLADYKTALGELETEVLSILKNANSLR